MRDIQPWINILQIYQMVLFCSPETRRRLRKACVTPHFGLGNHREDTITRRYLTWLLSFQHRVLFPTMKMMLGAVGLVSTWRLQLTNLISNRKVFTLTKRSEASGTLGCHLHIQIGYWGCWFIWRHDMATLSTLLTRLLWLGDFSQDQLRGSSMFLCC